MSRALATLSLLFALTACSGSSKAAEDPGGGDVRCTIGEYFVPGCSDEPGVVAGCYERCAYGAKCSDGTTCSKVTVMPACAMAEGDVACAACGEELELCVPGAVE